MDPFERAYLALLRAHPDREPTATELLATGTKCDDVDARVSRLCGQRERLRAMLQSPGIEQRTPPWYAARDELLTASDLGQALNCGKFGNRKQLMRKKVMRETMAEPGPGEFNPFKHGRVYESVALQLYRQWLVTPVGRDPDDAITEDLPEVHEFGLLRHPTFRCFGASPDGVTELGVMVEIKCPIKRKITGEVQEQYWMQMQGQMEVADLDACDFVEVELDTDAYMDLAEVEADVATPWDQKGLVVSMNAEADEDYVYSPPGADGAALREWLRSVGVDPRFIIKDKRVRMWRTRKLLVQRVCRDRAFWAETMPKVRAFWDEVEAGRKALLTPEGWNPDGGSAAKRSPTRRKKAGSGAKASVFPESIFGTA